MMQICEALEGDFSTRQRWCVTSPIWLRKKCVTRPSAVW